jgi:hypothetical protein
MVGILAFASVGILPGQTAPSNPPEQRIAKPNIGQHGSDHSPAQDGKKATPNIPPIASQPPTDPCDETCQQGRQNIVIQEKLKQFTGILAKVSVVQTVILILTIFSIVGQTRANKNSARAWVTANAVGNPSEPINRPGYTPGVVYQIEISGNSPAKIVRERFRCRIVPAIDDQPLLEKAPTFTSEKGMYPEVIRPAGNKYHIPVSLESGPITDQQWSDLGDGKAILCAYGCIEYEDTFKRPRYMRVCCIYHTGDGGVIESPTGIRLNPPGFRRGGPKGYNKYT